MTLKAEARNQIGTRAARAIRAAGRLPAIIYGHGEGVQTVTLEHHEVAVALHHGAHTLHIEFAGKSQQCLIKDVQYDHMGTTPVHMDLTRVDLDERVKVTVGIELRGTPKGATHGGLLDLHMSAIELECRVTDIPEVVRPIVTELEVGDSLMIKDLDLPEGVVATGEPNERIVTIHAPVTDTDDDAEATEESEASEVEPERIGRVRKDEEEGASGSKG